MKINKVTLETLEEFYKHPSVSLFRYIELENIYEVCNKYELMHPSLDIGCGDGYIAHQLFKDKFDYGVDNGEANDVHEAIKLNRYGNVLVESAEKISVKDNSLNFVFSNCVLEHIPPLQSVLSEVSRCLKGGGKFIITVPTDLYGEYLYLSQIFSKYKLPFLKRLYIKYRNKMLNHYHCYSIEQWREKIEANGMKIIEHKYYISKDALMLWDKMALGVFAGRIIGKDLNEKIRKKFIPDKIKILKDSSKNMPEGACVLIIAERDY
jgi:SAM-dependent methyltransferase